MSLQNTVPRRAVSSGFMVRAKRGWIGIDIGTSAIKLSQVEHCGSRFRISNRWTLSDPASMALNHDRLDETKLLSQLTQLKSLRRIFAGRNCAAVLPMSLVEYRSLEVPRGDASEQSRMVGEELSADLAVEPEELAFDCWENGSDAAADSELSIVSVIAARKVLVEQVATNLLSAGLECQALNGMPCALARAVEMSSYERTEEIVLALDLGYTSPLMVLVKAGRPLFTRTLRGVGLQTLMQPLESSLQISSAECQQLLVRYGVSNADQFPTLATQRTMQLIANPLQCLVSEIKRTIEYIGQKFRSGKPTRLCLFGGGALIKNFPEYLSQHLPLPANPWTLGGEHADPSDALFGVASGLSSLAWENGACS